MQGTLTTTRFGDVLDWIADLVGIYLQVLGCMQYLSKKLEEANKVRNSENKNAEPFDKSSAFHNLLSTDRNTKDNQ